MNNKKICFISCVNNDAIYDECLKYINNLNIPDGYSMDTMFIKEANNMAEGYNLAMKESDAKYKVYLHQDVFIINKNFIQDIIDIFINHPEVGLLGMVGAKTLDESGDLSKSKFKVGKVYESSTGKINLLSLGECHDEVEKVKIIDGFIMVTQYDLKWRDDLFNSWHLNDSFLSAESIIAGYKIVVPRQKSPWCIHDCRAVKTGWNNEKYNKIFAKQYLSDVKFKFFYFGNRSQIAPGFEVDYSQGISIGEDVVILKDACFMIPFGKLGYEPNIKIDDGCQFGRRLVISAAHTVRIGKKCIFASNIHITDHNHEYKKVGIPIMYQGITSFENEVIIGDGTWIANNCVVVGNVKIGRGCTIGANSVVTSNIPDYCVAVGSPARVVKAFDYVSGKWIKTKDNNELSKVLEDRRKSQPILSICIPTYNRSQYLDKCLKSIFDDIGNDTNIEVVVSDNNSEDNTKEIVDKYMKLYSNLKYFKNEQNIGADKNVLTVLKEGTGRFITVHGDDDYFAFQGIYKLVDKIYKNPNCGVFYIFNNSKVSEKIDCGINNFIKDVSFYSTYASGIILKKSDFDDIKENDKFVDLRLNQVYLQLSILLRNKPYCVLYDNFFSEAGAHRPSGYNFGEVFIQNYLEILYYFKNFGLNDETIKIDKKKLMEEMILPWCKLIKNGYAKLELNGIEEYIEKYYKGESYLEELLKIIREL
ncbi:MULTISPECIES: glycosyltransferase [Clostridium]|uniref:glycosyltransferase n=1 Tax=Clostridium TaxID=1485 RepID=UPI0008266588|nr:MULTISPECIES: glycosyltransferase [Clostridium]